MQDDYDDELSTEEECAIQQEGEALLAAFKEKSKNTPYKRTAKTVDLELLQLELMIPSEKWFKNPKNKLKKLEIEKRALEIRLAHKKWEIENENSEKRSESNTVY